jgi:hypothetical protein
VSDLRPGRLGSAQTGRPILAFKRQLTEQPQRAIQVHAQLSVFPITKPFLDPGLAHGGFVSFPLTHLDSSSRDGRNG